MIFINFHLTIGLELLWTMSSVLTTASCLAFYILINGSQNFNTKTVFVSISLIQTLRHALTGFPDVISCLFRTKVSFQRMIEFLNREEIENLYNDNENISIDSKLKTSILFDNITLSWGKNEKPFLRKIYADIPSGALVAVIGKVGCGKSALLSSIVGELYKIEGDLKLNGSIAYVPQNSFIQNATIKRNILFTSSYDKSRYQDVIYSCSLIPDFMALPAGDETEIGENGINLSGGQKQRISLSRAVYHNSDIYLLDDPFSALDTQTAKHIFQEVIGPKGLLAKKTRLWVTNDYSFLSSCDSIIALKDGQIDNFATFNELKKDVNFNFNHLMTDQIHKNIQRRSKNSFNKNSNKTSGVLVKEEEIKNKEITLNDFCYYIKNSGIKLIVLMAMTLLLSSFCETASDYWITKWTDNYCEIEPFFGLKIFISLITIQCFLVSISNVTTFYFSNNVSLKFFKQMLTKTVHLPMTFFNETPVGRIMTRFSRDLSIIESAIPYNIIFFLQNTIRILVIYYTISRLSFSLSIIIVIVLLCGYVLHVSLLWFTSLIKVINSEIFCRNFIPRHRNS